jgi:hypothetical protein
MSLLYGNNGSWFMVHSILSLHLWRWSCYRCKSKYNNHTLMIILWRLYVPKHIVEISTHICLLVSPSCEASVVLLLHHVILLHFYPQINDVFYIVCIRGCICRLSLGHPLPTYIILFKEKHMCTSAMIYKYMWFHNSPIYLHLVVSSTQDMVDKALCIDKFITCIIHVIPKYDKP